MARLKYSTICCAFVFTTLQYRALICVVGSHCSIEDRLGHCDAVSLDKFNVSGTTISMVWSVIDATRLSCAIIQKVSLRSWRIGSTMCSHLLDTCQHMSSSEALRAILFFPPDLRTKADHVRVGNAALSTTPSKDPYYRPIPMSPYKSRWGMSRSWASERKRG